MDSPSRIRALATVSEAREVLASPDRLDAQRLEFLRGLLHLATVQVNAIQEAKPRRYKEVPT